VRHSQSNLSSLAALLRNAEARHSATPPPLPLPDDEAKADDSGMIDILAMQQRAREERALAGVATKTPVPVVTAVRSATTDPDFVASLAESKRRTKRVALGVVAGAALVLAVVIGIKSARHHHAAIAQAALVAPPVAAAPAPPPPPAAPVVQAPAPPLPVVAAAAEPAPPIAPPTAKTKKGKGHKASHSAKAKGPKLEKISSSGVAN
jgi:hypothetical protein